MTIWHAASARQRQLVLLGDGVEANSALELFGFNHSELFQRLLGLLHAAVS